MLQVNAINFEPIEASNPIVPFKLRLDYLIIKLN